MHIDIKMIRTRRGGLEVFDIYVNGLRKHVFMSERHARTRYLQIINALKGASKC